MKDKFRRWLLSKGTLSDDSVRKYVSAIDLISQNMLSQNLIDKPIYSSVSPVEFYYIKENISKNGDFVKKNLKGNHMYSCALNHYLEFLLSS